MLRLIESALNPVGLAWLALIASGFALRRSHRRAASGIFALVILIWILGATPLHAWLLSLLERPYANTVAQNAPRADVALVLGGMIASPSPEAHGFAFSTAAGRFVSGLSLAKKQTVPILVFGGGPHGSPTGASSEGAFLKALLQEWAAVDCEIIALPPSLTTRDEFLNFTSIAEQRRWTNILLVTSAWHMTRARAAFSSSALKITPVAADFIGLPALNSGRGGFRIIPAVEPLRNFSIFLHEILGLAWYNVRGWT